jgi:hypothetical protein
MAEWLSRHQRQLRIWMAILSEPFMVDAQSGYQIFHSPAKRGFILGLRYRHDVVRCKPWVHKLSVEPCAIECADVRSSFGFLHKQIQLRRRLVVRDSVFLTKSSHGLSIGQTFKEAAQ